MARSKKTIVDDSDEEMEEILDNVSESEEGSEAEDGSDEDDSDAEDGSDNDSDSSFGEYDVGSEDEITGGASDEEEQEDDDEPGGTDDEDVTGIESDKESDEEEVNGEDEDGEEEVDYRPESRSCHLKDLNKEIPLEEDDSDIYGKLEWSRVPDEERMTDPNMTYYEIVGIIGIRAQQFSCGAVPLIEGIDHLPPHKMAYLELISGMTPFIISRRLPNKKYEEWYVDELTINHKINDSFFEPDNFNHEEFMERAAKILDEYRARRAAEKAAGKA